jgi:hypothetical protein
LSNRLHSEGEMCFEIDFVEIGYMRKSGKMRAPGPAADVDKLVAEEIRTIELLVPEIWPSQVSCLNCADFVFICVLTSFL